jgi:hypothetical protein
MTSPSDAVSSSSPDADQTKRVNVIFSNSTYNTLQDLASSQNISVSDALRQAINVSDLVVKANQDPKSRVLIDNAGQVQEIKLIR